MLDSVLTIAIGDVTSEGVRLSPTDWAAFQGEVLNAIAASDGTLVAHAVGNGLTSDQPEQVLEATAVFLVVNCDNPGSLRKALARILPAYGQGSACFAFQMAHEPVFATTTGFRDGTPLSAPEPVAPAVDGALSAIFVADDLEQGLAATHGRRVQP